MRWEQFSATDGRIQEVNPPAPPVATTTTSICFSFNISRTAL